MAKSVVACGLLLAVVLGVQDCSVQRENNKNLNPEIFDAFRRIERQAETKYRGLLDAGKDPEQYMSARELWVYQESYRALDAAVNSPDGYSVSAEEYYEQLYRRDFRLPPLYKAGYTERKSWWRLWE